MNTNSKNKKQAFKKQFTKQFSALFDNYTKEERIDKEAYVLHMKIMSEVEKKMKVRKWKKKDLAKAVGTSASYITQLFRGDRMVNLEMVAKFQEALGGEFSIKWCDQGEKIHIWKSLKNREAFVVPDVVLEDNMEAGAILAA